MAVDLTGQTFGRWHVISRAPDHVTDKGYHHIMWNCECECGTKKAVRGKSLTGNISRSCGCLSRELAHDRMVKHGGFGTRLYAVWDSMRQRCNNPKHHAYEDYGGRGIRVCSEWDDYSVFRSWALGEGYDESADRGEYTLDRKDVDQGYSPDNCRFTNMKEQANNRRKSIIVEHNGESHPLTDWAEMIGLDYTTLWKRYKNGQPIFND